MPNQWMYTSHRPAYHLHRSGLFVSDTDRKLLADGEPLIGMPSSPSARNALSPEGDTSGAVPRDVYE